MAALKSYRIGASSLRATYHAGTYVTDSAAEAVRMAREDYRRSPLGRALRDAAAFRFYVEAGDLQAQADVG